MGAIRAKSPNPYVPHTAAQMKNRLGEAIADRIRQSGMSCAAISRRYPSLRAGDLALIQGGAADLFGLNRLIATAEAVGLSVTLEIAA